MRGVLAEKRRRAFHHHLERLRQLLGQLRGQFVVFQEFRFAQSKMPGECRTRPDQNSRNITTRNRRRERRTQLIDPSMHGTQKGPLDSPIGSVQRRSYFCPSKMRGRDRERERERKREREREREERERKERRERRTTRNIRKHTHATFFQNAEPDIFRHLEQSLFYKKAYT